MVTIMLIKVITMMVVAMMMIIIVLVPAAAMVMIMMMMFGEAGNYDSFHSVTFFSQYRHRKLAKVCQREALFNRRSVVLSTFVVPCRLLRSSHREDSIVALTRYRRSWS